MIAEHIARRAVLRVQRAGELAEAFGEGLFLIDGKPTHRAITAQLGGLSSVLPPCLEC